MKVAFNFLLRLILSFVLGIFVLGMIGFVAYDAFVFQPRRSEILSLIDAAAPSERRPSPELIRLIEISSGGHVASSAARLLLNDLSVSTTPSENLRRQVTWLMWSTLVDIHFSEARQITIISSRCYMGNGRYGMAAESIARFQRPLAALTLDELATIVAITNGPSLYLSSPEHLVRRREWLLRRMHNGY